MEERAAEIEKLLKQLETANRRGQRGLWDRIRDKLDELLEKPQRLRLVWNEFIAPLTATAQEYGFAMSKVVDLNEGYFTNFKPTETLVKKVRSEVLLKQGLTPKGEIIPGGYWDTVANDTRIIQNVSRELWKRKGLPKSRAKNFVRDLVLGTENTKGILDVDWQEYTVDMIHQTDRESQRGFGNGLGMTASLYTGGIIKTTRDFCRVRNGKVFLDSEIELFGTAQDQYGGYTDKSAGLFSGKPKSYDPFTQLGGWGCRHMRSYITNEEALRRRKDLEEKNGVLEVKK